MIAKVTRDRFMQRMEERYPGWEFAAHVGYSTPEHRAAIERQGVSPLHRLSFQSMAYQQLALWRRGSAWPRAGLSGNGSRSGVGGSGGAGRPWSVLVGAAARFWRWFAFGSGEGVARSRDHVRSRHRGLRA